MHPLIENNREAIARLCRLHGVRSLEAFGSILRHDFDAGRSDVDVLVEFDAQAAGVYLENIEHYAAAAVRFTSGWRHRTGLA
jgi:predicted nucleotidyltransferase